MTKTEALAVLRSEMDRLQSIYGEKGLRSIPGAGYASKPEVMFVFMNPTGRNVSAHPDWSGLRAPWLGTKNIWRMFRALDYLPGDIFKTIQSGETWTPTFAKRVYRALSSHKIFVTNLAKCTQKDARSLPDSVFKNYRHLIIREISIVKPRRIVVFGNQASSILLGKPISVTKYSGLMKEDLFIADKTFPVYPVFYPVGQGMRNMPLAIDRIRQIIK